MKILLLAIGKTDSKALDELIGLYTKRIPHYLPFELKIIPDIKCSAKIASELQRTQEGNLILAQISNSDRLVLFDERGQALSSVEFSKYLESKMISGEKRIVFVIGGPYGFSQEVYDRADEKITLSRMTFSHQMVRLFACEQIYRAMTILKGEPYHHD